MTQRPQIRLYNSLAREKIDFVPIDEKDVRLYACGPTVYNYAHIGNARMAVVFDVLARLLKHVYGDAHVKYVSNITDVDDKIMAAAKETGRPIDEITAHYTTIYNDDMSALGCALPDVQPRATTHIAEMVTLIEGLISRGMAYDSEGHVLFNVPAYGDAYGALSGRSRDEQIAGSRVEVASYKKDPADFVLWKPSADGEPGWDSPWGRGRPGWHIECSAMAEKHLKLPFDIHGGGADLKFPHHENEIAQSCGAHNLSPEDFARVWVHNGFVTVEGEKMSKSLGNVTLVHDLIADPAIAPMMIRLALLSAQYRKPLDWSAQALHQAEIMLGKIEAAMMRLIDVEMNPAEQNVDAGVMAALCDDLNTPLAFTRLGELLKKIGQCDDAQEMITLKSILHNTLDVLGVDIALTSARAGEGHPDTHDSEHDAEIDALVTERTQAKANKNFARADEIRDELAAMGVEITDTPNGPVWKRT